MTEGEENAILLAMLQKSFIHLPGVGASTEKRLWDRGVSTWTGLLEQAPSHFTSPRLEVIVERLAKSIEAWEQRNPLFFYETLPRTELWRLVPEFIDDVAYLDIETNGLRMPPESESTTITFYFRGQLYQEHEHRAKALLVQKIDDEARVFCSFFGEVFDIPFLRKEFGVPLRKAHWDLCFWLKRLGFNGGLKKVEKQFPDIPSRAAMDIDGFDAVRLWNLHKKGTSGALETLLTYNAEDTIVLEGLLVRAFNLEVAKHSDCGLDPLPIPEMAKLSTRIDPSVYEQLRTYDRSTADQSRNSHGA